jgi:guanylate kinase
MKASQQPSLLYIISGPAGCGKTTLCEALLAVYPSLNRVVTATTRAPRAGEVDGIDYYFLDASAFQSKIEADDFYEYAKVHTNMYGTLKSEIRDKLGQGVDLLLNIDVQGAATFRNAATSDPLLAGRVVTIFIDPPSMEELERRLRGRASESEATLQVRLKTARAELEQAGDYDYCLPSGNRTDDFKRIEAIYLAEKMRQRREALA